jgi:putative serine protease PepD
MLAAALVSAIVATLMTTALLLVVAAPGTTAPASGGTGAVATSTVAPTASPGADLTRTGVTVDETAIVAEAEKSVVTITTSLGRGSGVGSGIVLTAKGLILTNDHVIADGGSITVLLPDGRSLDASVVAEDSAADLAVIRVDASDLVPAQLGDSSTIQVGQTVFAIGTPLGEYIETVTQGIVSATDREITVRGEFTGRPTQLSHLIQTDAAINPGNSGGPLIDTSGRVIAITTATSTQAAGLGFAIPIDDAKAIIAQAEAGS